MNKFNKIAAFSLSARAMNGSAHAEGWYAGLDLTTSKMDLDGAAKDAYDAKVIDDQLDGGSLIVGYSFKPWLAVEGGLHAQQIDQLIWVTSPIASGFADTTIDTLTVYSLGGSAGVRARFKTVAGGGLIAGLDDVRTWDELDAAADRND